MKNEINAVLENMTTTIPEPEEMCIRDRLKKVKRDSLK